MRVRLLPHRAGDLTTVVGSGYAAMFALTAASMGFSIYGPPILQQTRGFTPLWAGYAVGAESMAWTVAAMAVAGAGAVWDRRWIRVGCVLLIVSLAMLPFTLADGPLAGMLIAGGLMGAAFGFSWAFMSRRVLTALRDEDKAVGSSGITAVRQSGAAAGAAISGVAANIVGFSGGLSDASAHAATTWVFVSVIPLALAGTWAAFRLTGPRSGPRACPARRRRAGRARPARVGRVDQHADLDLEVEITWMFTPFDASASNIALATPVWLRMPTPMTETLATSSFTWTSSKPILACTPRTISTARWRRACRR
jgi:hypothetical protein